MFSSGSADVPGSGESFQGYLPSEGGVNALSVVDGPSRRSTFCGFHRKSAHEQGTVTTWIRRRAFVSAVEGINLVTSGKDARFCGIIEDDTPTIGPHGRTASATWLTVIKLERRSDGNA